MKILEFIRYYSLENLETEFFKEHAMPLHQLWNWEYLKAQGNQLCEIIPQELSLSVLHRQLFMDNIKQQKLVLKKNTDIIYAPFMGDAYYIAFLKSLHLCKTPLIAISQDTWDLDKTSSLKNKLKYAFLRYIAKHGVDKLLFISPNVYNHCKEYFSDTEKHIPLQHWGVDIEYYDKYFATQQKYPSNDYIYVTGGANRDFQLIQDICSIDSSVQFLVQTNRCPEEIRESNNLTIDRTPQTWNDLLSGYYNCRAVAIPLKYDISYLSGITVVLEGMACRKPILSTESTLYPFDIEKEKIGFSLPFNDKNAWIDAIKYLENNPDEAKEMGERGRFLVEHKHNYKLFCEELYNEIKKAVK